MYIIDGHIAVQWKRGNPDTSNKKTCVYYACSGREGIQRRTACTAFMVDSFVRRTQILLFVGVMLTCWIAKCM